MKDFFEDLGKRLGETAETVTNKAGEAIEIQRLKSKVRRLARENAVDLMEMGRMVYDGYKDGKEVSEEAEALCQAISGREDNMNRWNKKIAELKGAFECRSCGKMVAKDMSFCPYCGAKAEKEVCEGEVCDGEEAESGTDGSATSDDMKEKAADAAKNMAQKAEKAAKKAGEMAEKAAKKTSEMAEKAAEKVDDIAGKAAQKAGKAAEKAADKLKD